MLIIIKSGYKQNSYKKIIALNNILILSNASHSRDRYEKKSKEM